jgi:hypothetical protein
MNKFSNALFVAEFELSDVSTSAGMIDMMNNYGGESVNGGSFSLESIDTKGNALSGRYILRNEVLSDSEYEYQMTMIQDLSLLMKQKINISRLAVLKLGIKENFPIVKELDESFTINKDPSGDFVFLLNLIGGQTEIHGPFLSIMEAEAEYQSLV